MNQQNIYCHQLKNKNRILKSIFFFFNFFLFLSNMKFSKIIHCIRYNENLENDYNDLRKYIKKRSISNTKKNILERWYLMQLL